MVTVGDVIKLCPLDLSKTERESITSVLYKNLLFVDKHQKHLLSLRKEIHGIKVGSTVVSNVDYSKTCLRCRSPLSKNTKCWRCKQLCCSTCQTSFQHHTGITYWLCILCAKQRTSPPLFGNASSLYPSNQPSSSGSYTSINSSNNTSRPVLLPRDIPSFYRSEPVLDGPVITMKYPTGQFKDAANGMGSTISLASFSQSREDTGNNPNSWSLTRSEADLSKIVDKRSGALKKPKLLAIHDEEDLTENDNAVDNNASFCKSQPNLFSHEVNLRGSMARRPVRRRSSNISTKSKTENAPEITATIRFKTVFDGRSKGSGGFLKIYFEDCSLVTSTVDVTSARVCQFGACVLPRANSGLYFSKSVQLPHKTNRLGLEITIPVYRDDVESLNVHISLWLLKASFSHLREGKPNVKRAVLGEATLRFQDLMNLGSGEHPFPLKKSKLEFPIAHASGSIQITVTLHSAKSFNSLMSRSSNTSLNKSGSFHNLSHRLSPRRTPSCDHLCLQVHSISGLLLPGGIKKFQLYCKTRLLPIKTDEAKTKSFSLSEIALSKLKYNSSSGGVLEVVDWPENCKQICVGDMMGMELAGGRCLEMLLVNKARGTLSLSGSAGKTVLGCVRLGPSTVFDSTATESAIWKSIVDNPDTPVTTTLLLRPNENTLLSLV